MRKFLALIVTMLLLLAGLSSYVMASNVASHTVTVTVTAINEIAITGGNITLTINAAVPGVDPTSVTNSTCGLSWTTNETAKKVTVATDQATPTFTLDVLATAVSGTGAAAGSVTVSTTDTDFVTGMATTIGGCTLSYTASATAAEGTGSDVHSITYTLTDE